MQDGQQSPEQIDPIEVINELKRHIGEMAQANAMLEVLVKRTTKERDDYKTLAERVNKLEIE